MALPVFTGWSVSHWTRTSVGDSRRDTAAAAKALKDFLVTRDWIVRRSSTNSVIADLDQWTSDTAFSFNAWTVLRHSVSGRELVLHLDSGGGSYNNVLIYLSRSGVFIGNSATQAPTATDRETLGTLTMGTNTSALYNRRQDYWYNGDDFRIIFHSNVTMSNMLVIDSVDSPRVEVTENWGIKLVSSPTIANWSNNTEYMSVTIDGLVCNIRMTALGNVSGWLVEQASYSAALPDGEWAIQPAAHWVSSNIAKAGIVGKCRDWYFIHPNVVSGTTLPADGSRTHIVFNNVVLPWDGTTSWSA